MVELRDLVRVVADPSATESDRLTAERQLCQRMMPRLRLYGLRHLRDEAAAADLVQETMIVLFQAARDGRIEEPEHVERFLLGTCRNIVRRWRRNERRAGTFGRAVVPLLEAETPPAFSSVDAARLALCLGRMRAREQRVVLLTFQEGRSAEEIASELGTTAGNVRVLRHRTMAALQRCVEGAA